MTKTRIRYLIASLIGIAVGSFFGLQAGPPAPPSFP